MKIGSVNIPQKAFIEGLLPKSGRGEGRAAMKTHAERECAARRIGDKQLHGIRLADVLEKCRWEQALNAKEFAVLAGVSYSTARAWFRLPGFPVFQGVVFWPDFVQWRTQQNGLRPATVSKPVLQTVPVVDRKSAATGAENPAAGVKFTAHLPHYCASD
jgi:hypothetical protein